MAKDDRFQHRSGLEVAVIGMAGRFPGARSVDELWRNLRAGVESITFFSEEELAAAGVPADLYRDPNYVPAKGYLEDADLFDADFFAIRPREAEVLDPQHRLFLECAWEAIESGGYDLERYAGWIGVYGGCTMSSYFLLNLRSRPDLLAAVGHLQVGLANDKDHLATRVSYKLGLEGPSLSVQTACSTSLVAVHLACQALLRGECDMALAGGVSVGLPLKSGYLYQEGGILSPDGHCRAFDADAGGCVGGNGVGVVLLKKLDEALADGDTVHAVIKGSAINNDGALKVGYTAPRIDGQAKVIRAAHIVADVPPESIGFVEAHGTATELGDPAEIAALTQAFSAGGARRRSCAIGSVKTNLGHLDAAAGVTGLIKAALALQHREIPPSLHFRQPSSHIDFASTPFFVNAETRPWTTVNGARRAGVSSFGLGGTNAHAVLEEAPPRPPSEPSREWQLLLLSARTPAALERAEKGLTARLEEGDALSLADVAYTLQVGRKAFARRRICVCRDRREAASALSRPAPEEDLGHRDTEAPPRSIAFLLPGQGAQKIGMMADLYRAEPTYREQLDRCAELLRPHLGLDLRAVLDPPPDQEDEAAAQLRSTALAQPALFAVEYATARLWEGWGIRPQALLGHSLGEIVAACLAGVLGLEDALRLVARRGALMQALPPGGMLSVPLSETEVTARLAEGLELAAVNGPASCVVSGSCDAIGRFDETLTREGVAARRLETSHAFHSAMMEEIRERFAEEVDGLELRAPQVPWLSNLTGTWIEPQQATDPAYWGDHLRHTVRFGAGLEHLVASPERILLEVGPWGGLATLARRHPQRHAAAVVVSSAPPPRQTVPGQAHLLRALGQLWLAGAQPDWSGFYRGEKRRRVVLPTYPFERRRYWIEAAPQEAAALATAPADASRRARPDEWFWVPSWKRALPRIGGGEPRRGPWLILLDDLGLGRELARQLAQRGEQVTTAVTGEGFARLQEGSYRLDPGRREDYAALLERLCAAGAAPREIVHLWAVDGGRPGPERAARQRGFGSLIQLAQAVGEQLVAGGFGSDVGRASPALTVISDHVHPITGEEALRPEKATLLGPVRVIPQEYPNFRCRNLDVVMPAADGEARRRLAARLIEDLLFPGPQPVVGYRGGERWVPIFDRLRLEEPAPVPALRPGGCYLITGGLGGIGLEVARGLAAAVQAKLVLTGRSPLPGRDEWERRIADGGLLAEKLAKLREIEHLGGEALVLQADVGDETAMRRAIAAATARFGSIHGVVHSAGLPGSTLIQRQTPEAAAQVLRPKVDGTLVLDRLFADAELDFFILFSSQRSYLGGAGQVDYCAANCFADAFAGARSRQGRPTLAVGWGGWSEVGMTRDLPVRGGAEEEEGADEVSNREGWLTLVRLLGALELPQVVVCTGDFPQRLERFWHRREEAVLAEATATGRQAASHPRPPLATPYVAARDEIEAKLAEIWSRLLGVTPIGVDDNFFELGGDSVVSLQIVSQANQAGLRLTPQQVFQHQTIAGLAAVAGTGQTIRARQDLVTGELPLTPIQHWFFDTYRAYPRHYNQAVLLRCGERLEGARLERAVGRLLEHHDALRLRFEQTGSGWRQVCAPPGGERVCGQIDLSRLSGEAQPAVVTAVASQLQASFDLGRGPLCRVALIELGGGRPQRLLWIIHHLAVDVVSWRILLQDLQSAYASAGGGDPAAAPLPAKTTSYQDWARRLSEHARSPELLAGAAVWLERPWEQVRRLPADPAGTGHTWGTVDTETLVLDRETTRALVLEVPRRVRAQVNDLLLTALARAFRAWTGEPRLVVDLEAHGREAIFEDVDLSRTVGWFTSIYPVLLDLDGTSSPGEELNAVKEQLRRVPHNGLGYGLLRYLGDPDIGERLAQLPQAEVIFLYTGHVDEAVAPSVYSPAPEAPGANQSPHLPRRHLIDVTVSIEGEQLRVYWTSSRVLWPPEVIRGLMRRYEEALRGLIQACLSGDAPRLTPADFPLAALSGAELEVLRRRVAAPEASEPAGREPIEDIYPLSPVQEGLLFHTLYEPGSGVYVTDIHWTFRGELDVVALRRAWHHVLARHTALRTVFTWERLRRPLQVVLSAVELPLEEHDWRRHDDREERFQCLLRAERGRGFDLERPPLLRLHLLRLEDDLYRLLWTFHHLLIDGWAVHRIFDEVITGYAAFRQGCEPDLGEAHSYRGYIAWLQRQDLTEAEAFWRRTLAGFTRPAPLPGALERPADDTPPPAARQVRRSVTLAEEAASALSALGRRHQLTLNSIVQGAWGLLLAAYARGLRDVVFGTVLSGRPDSLEGVESMVGLFINTLPVRLRIEPELPLIPWLQRLQEQQVEMRRFEHSPLVEVQRWTEVPRELPLFETILVFESFPSVVGREEAGLDLEIVAAGGTDQNSYPVTLTIYPRREVVIEIAADGRWYDPAAVGARLDEMARLLARMAERPEATLGELLAAQEADRRLARARAAERRHSDNLAKLRNLRPVAVEVEP